MSPGAGGLSPGSCLPLAENGAPRDGTEEVLSLEQYPPTKRLKTNPCNAGKEQRVEEDQTRGIRQRELGGAWPGLGIPKSTGKPVGAGSALCRDHELGFQRQKLLWSHAAHLVLYETAANRTRCRGLGCARGSAWHWCVRRCRQRELQRCQQPKELGFAPRFLTSPRVSLPLPC